MNLSPKKIIFFQILIFVETLLIRDVDEFVCWSEQIWRNVALHHLLTNGSTAVNGCRHNESQTADKYSLNILSFWRHPFTAALVSKWCNATFLQICSDEKTNVYTSWLACGWVNIQQINIFGWTIPFSLLSCEIETSRNKIFLYSST